MTDNIAASSWQVGFRLPSWPCDKSPPRKLSGNVAHSISGFGLIVIGGQQASDCNQFDGFAGYKNQVADVQMSGAISSFRNELRNIVSIDSDYGIMAFPPDEGELEIKDSIMYGSMNMENQDCPLSNRSCNSCFGTRGLMLPVSGSQTVETHLAPKKIPKKYAGGEMWGKPKMSNLKFIGFDQTTNECGARQAAISTNVQPDIHPIMYFRNAEFINTDQSALFDFDDPPQSWANMSDCWDFTCTGLYNVLVELEDTKYSGIPRAFGMPRDFKVTSDNKESVSSQVVPTCEKNSDWNAYMCTKEDLGVLVFESEDADKMDRASQPIYIVDEDRGFNNRLNAFMDHGWDGAYTSQKRLQKFPTFIDTARNYTIDYTGTPPSSQKFTLHANKYDSGTLITIPYEANGAYVIYDEMRELVEPTIWDDVTETWAVPKGTHCGENRYLGVENRLEFWIEPECTLYVRHRDAIMLAIRLEWTVKEFYEDGGVG